MLSRVLWLTLVQAGAASTHPFDTPAPAPAHPHKPTVRLVVSVDGGRAVHTVSAGGEAGLMEDLGCAEGYVQGNLSSSGCPFGRRWFRQRLGQLGAGGGNSMRLGGGMQACVVYNVTGLLTRIPTDAHVVKAYCQSRGVVVIDRLFWNAVLDDMVAANVTLIFGVNAAIGRQNPGPRGAPPANQRWAPGPSGFDELLKYTAETRPAAVFGWEFGNEPRAGKYGYMPDGETLADDCAAVRGMVAAAYAGPARVPLTICPDWENAAEPPADGVANEPCHHDCNKTAVFWQTIDAFNAAATAPRGGDPSGSVDALTLHWYPASSRDKHDAREDLNASRLDVFGQVFRRFQKAVAPGWPGQVWAGETASLQNGGSDGVSNAFQSTTWLYDQLGQQGDVGVARMLRESLTSSRYATVNATDGSPFPDFFSTVLWRQVVGHRVLIPTAAASNERIDNRGQPLRVYARCARARGAAATTGEVVLVVVNLSPTVAGSVIVAGARAGGTKKEWVLTASNWRQPGSDVWDWGRSKLASLNGNVLRLTRAGDLPPLTPRETSPAAPVTIAPLSVALIQFEPATAAAACGTAAGKSDVARPVEHTGAAVTIKSNDGRLALTLEQGSGLAALRMRSVSVNGTTTALSNRSGLSLGVGGETVPVSNGGSSVLHLAGGGVAFRRALAAGAHTASLTETLAPVGRDAISWTLTINGTSAKLWSPSIGAVLEAAGGDAVAGKKLWLPWSKPQNGCSRPPSAACEAVCNGYASPLEPVPTACLLRGGTAWGYGGGGSVVSVPLAAMLDTISDTAVTLSVAPAPNLISLTNMQMKTTGTAIGVALGSGYRVSSSSAGLSLTFHITGSQACPWDVLARYSRRHAEYFEPPNRNVHYRASGMGSYAATQGPLTQVVDGAPLITTMKEVGYSVNWDATFWWPYIMQIAPTIAAPSNETVLWGSSFDKVTGFNNRLSTVHVKASYAIRDAYYARWQKANLTVLGYFNGWELGQQMTDYPPAAGSCPPAPDLWRSAPCFIHTYLDSALCTDAGGHRNVGAGSSGWDGDTMLDPGTELYRGFLKTQVQNHLDMEPHFMGLASDGIRACVNFGGDDGVSCLATGAAAESACRPVQDGFTAWHALMSEVSPMLASRDKIFSANTVNGPRIHQFRFADLFITEQSAHDYGSNCVNSFLGLHKPGVMWTTSTSTTDCPHGDDCSDRFFQRLLHLGLFPMPPMPDADHSLQNGSAINHAAFVRYGPLFKMLRGREWALRPHAVSVSVQGTAAELARLQTAELTPETVQLTGNVATLASCSASDRHQLWQNLTKPPYCTGKQPCGELASVGSPGSCLEVQSGAFSPSACGNGAVSSNIWIYACTTDGPQLEGGRSRDCPQHENVQWRLTGALLRSAVPAGPPPGPTAVPWDTCLVTTAAAAPLTLAVCNASDPRQHWTATPVGNGSDFQLKQGERCVSSVTSGPPPPPPAPPPAPVPTMPPVANLFKDQFGAEIVVITSPGSAVNMTVAVTVRGSGFSSPTASVVRPGEAAPSAVPTVRVHGGDVVVVVELVRGAAVIKLTQ